MTILFLSDNFPPEYNAPATRTYEHCKEWVQRGANVVVITCAPNFPKGEVFEGYRNRWKQVEHIDGIKVIRVWSFITANSGFFKRTLDFISYAVASFLCGLTVKCDIIVATSPQFFTAVSGCMLGFFKRKRWVMEVRDLWPESIKAVEAVQTGWIIRALEKLELFLYRKAYKIVVVTDSFKKILIARGIQEEKIYVVKNGVVLSNFKPNGKNQIILEEFGLQQKFVVGYIGTHGLAHSLDFIVRSVSKIQDPSIHFIFIGDGAEKANVIKISKELALSNVTFIDPVKKGEIHHYLSMLDIALVPLRKSTTFESVIPSKVFESVAMNLPILLGVDGETRSIIESYNAGLFFEPENETEFLDKLVNMKQEIQRNNPYMSGCQKMAFDFDRKNLAKQMLDILST